MPELQPPISLHSIRATLAGSTERPLGSNSFRQQFFAAPRFRPYFRRSPSDAARTVLNSEPSFHCGLYLRIRHCASVETAYAHLAAFTPGLQVGSTVSRGQIIAEVGRTGWATGPHLYYEVIVNGHRINPSRPGLQVPVDLPPAVAPQQPATQQTATSGTS